MQDIYLLVIKMIIIINYKLHQYDELYFNDEYQWWFNDWEAVSNAELRDTNAWYHIVVKDRILLIQQVVIE